MTCKNQMTYFKGSWKHSDAFQNTFQVQMWSQTVGNIIFISPHKADVTPPTRPTSSPDGQRSNMRSNMLRYQNQTGWFVNVKSLVVSTFSSVLGVSVDGGVQCPSMLWGSRRLCEMCVLLSLRRVSCARGRLISGLKLLLGHEYIMILLAIKISAAATDLLLQQLVFPLQWWCVCCALCAGV